MDKQQDTFRNLLFAAAIFFTVLWLAPKLLPVVPPTSPSQVADGTVPSQDRPAVEGAPSTGRSGAVVGSDTAAGVPSAESTSTPTGTALAVVEAKSERTLAIGSDPANGIDTDPQRSPYRMRLTLSNVGASIESATTTDHAEELHSPDRYKLLSLVEGEHGAGFRSLAIERISVDGVPLTLHDKKWHTDGTTAYKTASGEEGERVTFWIEVHEEGQATLKLTRTFTLLQQPAETGRHDLHADIRVDNLSDRPKAVIVTYRGGLGVRRTEGARIVDQYVDWGIFRDGRVGGTRETYTDVTKLAQQGRPLYTPSPAEPGVRLSWAATANTYFTCTIAPQTHDGADNPGYLAKVEALDVDGSAITANDATLRFVTRSATVEPNQSIRYPAAIYLGEKDGKAFRRVEDYARRNYYYQIAQGFGWCTFTWLVELMVWLLNSLHLVVRDFGVAIIILVLVVRTLLHPITKKGQVNMVRMQQRMQEVAPKIEEIKKKYANDKARLNQEMMKLNINPAGQLFTCLPMMLQMPIWVALFLSLSNNILMRHQPCVFLPWIHDLTAQDALYTFSAPFVIPIFGWVLPSFNMLPILVAVFMYTQQKLQPKPAPNPNMSDQQKQQQEMMQKMMPMMSIMMLVIFYKMPAGLNLYIMSSSLFGTIEQKRIRKHIKEREKAGTLHKPEKKQRPAAEEPRKPGKRSLLERLQKAAAEAQKTQAQRASKVKRRR